MFFIFRHRLQLSTTVSCMRDTRPHSLASTVSQDSIRVTQQVFPSISSSYWMPASEAAKDQMCHFHPTLLTIGNKQTISRSRILVFIPEVANYSMFPVDPFLVSDEFEILWTDHTLQYFKKLLKTKNIYLTSWQKNLVKLLRADNSPFLVTFPWISLSIWLNLPLWSISIDDS